MYMLKTKLITTLVISSCLLAQSAIAAPKKIACNLVLDKPASFIMEKFAAQNPGTSKRPFKILFGDGEWVIKSYDGDTFTKFYIDMNDGKISNTKDYTRKHAFDYYSGGTWDKKNLTLDTVINKMEKAGYMNIEFVQWAGNKYKAHVCKDHAWLDVIVDAKSGVITPHFAQPSLEIQ